MQKKTDGLKKKGSSLKERSARGGGDGPTSAEPRGCVSAAHRSRRRLEKREEQVKTNWIEVEVEVVQLKLQVRNQLRRQSYGRYGSKTAG
ncbi:hypothetical protein F0562_025212 [Nyssa sinensis]|uniref:Uncharacterized protein n=1 Tax=Nyssa sinensis TaxID=561372 RepID=A0A5J5BJ62_9ASTE|nr:hypothetical protein F0562_025212 [Nyssa sinensis]